MEMKGGYLGRMGEVFLQEHYYAQICMYSGVHNM